MSQLTFGQIEYEAVWMLERAHVGLHELTERDFHISTVRVFSERYGYDCGMRSGTSGVLGRSRARGQAGQKQNKRYY
jgi:hypothetical protein